MRRRMAPSCLLFLALAVAAARAEAASYRLSSGQSFSDVGAIAADPELAVPPIFSPDGRWLVYLHDAETDGAHELWRAPVHGGPTSRLSGLLPSGQRVTNYRFTPDGATVVYNAPQEELTKVDLYAAPLLGPPGSFVKVNDPIADGMMAKVVGFSPDGTRCIYAVCLASSTNACTKLFVAELDGSGADLIYEAPFVTSSSDVISDILTSPDFARVAFLRFDQLNARTELWSVPTSGGEATRLNGALVAGGEVKAPFAMSGAGDSVAYVADQQTNDVDEVYVAPIDGGLQVKVSPPLPVNDDASKPSFAADGAHVLFYVTSPGAVVQLWSATPDGQQKVRLNGDLPAGGTVVGGFSVLGGTHALYAAEQDLNDVLELYSVPIGGGVTTKLNLPLVAGRSLSNFALSPDETMLFYVTDVTTDERFELWRVPTLGGTTFRVSHQVASPDADWDVLTLAAAADSSGIAYTYRFQNCAGCLSNEFLFRGDADADEVRRLDGCPGGSRQVVATPVASPTDPKRFAYIADQEVNGRFDLYVGDDCLLCDGFESGATSRWNQATP